MSTKSPSKFWKKLGLGKKGSSTQTNRPPSIQSHATHSTTLANNEDDHSMKNKRLSGVFPHRKQSTNSIKRLHQMSAAQPETPHVPAVPSGSNTTTTTAATSAAGSLESKQPPPVEKDDTTSPPVELARPPNHVEPSTPPPMDPDLSKQGIPPTLGIITHHDIQTDNPPPSALNIHSRSTENPPSAGINQQQQQQQPSPTTPMTTKTNSKPTTGTKLVKSTKSASSLKKSSNQSLSQPKSRLRQPSRTNSTAGSTTTPSATPSASSSTSSLQLKEVPRLTTATSTPPPPMPSLIPSSLHGASNEQKDELILQLQEALQTEQSVNRVLQGQKEAITKDLDYFSLTVDELMEEKEALVQKYEEEKLKSQTKEEDLNVLLEKLKSSTDNARDRSMEVDQWKAEIENIKEEMTLEQNDLKSVLKRKDQEIIRLKNELATTQEQVNTLSSRLEALLEETAAAATATAQQQTINGSHSPNLHQSMAAGAIETPNPSPRLDAQLDEDSSRRHDKLGNRTKAHPPNLSVSTAPLPSCHALDDELMSLTKEKERLQSDYGKIPLSGGGPTSRRRKEQLEEMLDEVDSQLSKVKQKIRRS